VYQWGPRGQPERRPWTLTKLKRTCCPTLIGPLWCERDRVSRYMYVHVCTCTYIYVHLSMWAYVYTCVDREREREKERGGGKGDAYF